MNSESNLTPYKPTTIPPEPVTASEFALAIDAVCTWLRNTPEASEKWRDMQRLRLKLMHHEIQAEARERRVPA